MVTKNILEKILKEYCYSELNKMAIYNYVDRIGVSFFMKCKKKFTVGKISIINIVFVTFIGLVMKVNCWIT